MDEDEAMKSPECTLCTSSDKEDLLLITKAIIVTLDGFERWPIEGKFGLYRLDSETKVRQMFRMINFQKLIQTILEEKHSLKSDCQHHEFEE